MWMKVLTIRVNGTRTYLVNGGWFSQKFNGLVKTNTLDRGQVITAWQNAHVSELLLSELMQLQVCELRKISKINSNSMPISIHLEDYLGKNRTFVLSKRMTCHVRLPSRTKKNVCCFIWTCAPSKTSTIWNPTWAKSTHFSPEKLMPTKLRPRSFGSIPEYE